jgi:hypothetical protein
MTLNELIKTCFEINPNTHVHNGNVFYINCYGFGTIRRSDNEYYVSSGILETFRYTNINKLSFDKLQHLHAVLEIVLERFKEIQNEKNT